MASQVLVFAGAVPVIVLVLHWIELEPWIASTLFVDVSVTAPPG